MAKLHNGGRMTTATAGTGTVTLGSAVDGYLTFALAGVSDGSTVSYGIVDGSNWEVGTGVYTSSGTTLTRNVTKSTNSDAAISLSGSAQVYLTPRAEDLFNLGEEGQTFAGGFSVTAKSQTAGALTATPSERPMQYITNSGAFTLTAPSEDGLLDLLITNDATAGAITWSGFTVGSNVGDSLTTTDTHKFQVRIARINGVSTYFIQALQ